MILQTPLYTFCNGNLYGNNIVVIRKEIPEYSFFQYRYTWTDVKKFIKDIKSGNSINLTDYISKEEMSDKEKLDYNKKFKLDIIHDLIKNGIPSKHIDKQIVFRWRGDDYFIDIFTLQLFYLKRYDQSGVFSNDSIVDSIRGGVTTIPAIKAISGELCCIDAQNKLAENMFIRFKECMHEYHECLNHLIHFIGEFNIDSDESIVTFYRAIYGIDIDSEDFRYQNIDIDRLLLS